MTNSENRNPPDTPHRSFVPSDFSLRDIPFTLLAFIVISVASTVLGLFVESLSTFWRGYVWGIVTTIAAMAILWQVSSTKPKTD
jgi:hypothetical protein